MISFDGWQHRAIAVYLGLILAIPAARTCADDDPPGAYQAPAPDPSPIETLMLEYINRCRANPAEDGPRCASSSSVPGDVDLKMFMREMSEAASAPPLVFDLRLLKAARWHCHYQILNGQGHAEEEGKQGFTGVSPTDRVNHASYRGGVAENAFVGPKDPWYCHVGFVVDWGNGEGGMQPERGHRRNILNPDYRLAGIGAVPYDGDKRFACTHNLGGASERFVGGVVINDRNKNRFYDLGEGLQGISLAAGDATLKSWFSGAYTLPIAEKDAKVSVELDGKKYTASIPDGSDNVKLDVFVNEKANYHAVGALLATLKKLPAGDMTKESRRLAAEIDLAFATQGTFVEDDLFEEVQALARPIREKVRSEMDELRKTIADAPIAEARPKVKAAAQKYSATRVRPWFTEAAICLEMRDAYQMLADMKLAGKPMTSMTIGRVLKKQQGLYQQLTTPEWKNAGREWGRKTNALSEVAAPMTPSK